VPGFPETADPCEHVPCRLLYTTVRLPRPSSSSSSSHHRTPTLPLQTPLHLKPPLTNLAPPVSAQIGNIISSNIYRADDAPLYHRGNSVLIGINVLVLLCFLGAKGYYILQNKRREKKWQALSEQERRDYVNNSTDQGNKRLDFRFAH